MLMFDTLKLSRGLQAAGMPQAQADGFAAAVSDATQESVATKADLAEAKADILKWVLGALGLQTVVVIGALVTLVAHR